MESGTAFAARGVVEPKDMPNYEWRVEETRAERDLAEILNGLEAEGWAVHSTLARGAVVMVTARRKVKRTVKSEGS